MKRLFLVFLYELRLFNHKVQFIDIMRHSSHFRAFCPRYLVICHESCTFAAELTQNR